MSLSQERIRELAEQLNSGVQLYGPSASHSGADLPSLQQVDDINNAYSFSAPSVEIEGTRLSDYGKLAGAGAADTVASLAWVADQLTGGNLEWTGDVQSFADSVKNEWISNTTPAMQAALSKKFVEERDGDYSFGDAWADPAAVLGGIVMSAPGMIGGIGAAKIAAKGSRKAAQLMGAGTKGEQAAVRAGAMAGGGAFEGAAAGGSVGAEVEKMVMEAPVSELAQHSESFQRIYNETKDINRARTETAKLAAQQAATGAGAVTAVLGAPFNDLVGRIYAGAQKGGRGIRALKGMALEAPTEALQSAGEATAKQIAGNTELGREVSTGDILNESAAGFAAGGVLGGMAGVISPSDAPAIQPETGAGIPKPVPAQEETKSTEKPVVSENVPTETAEPGSAPAEPEAVSNTNPEGMPPYWEMNPQTGEASINRAALWDHLQKLPNKDRAKLYREANERRLQGNGSLSEEDAYTLSGLEMLFLRQKAETDPKAATTELLSLLGGGDTSAKNLRKALKLGGNQRARDIRQAAEAFALGQKQSDIDESLKTPYGAIARAFKASLPKPSAAVPVQSDLNQNAPEQVDIAGELPAPDKTKAPIYMGDGGIDMDAAKREREAKLANDASKVVGKYQEALKLVRMQVSKSSGAMRQELEAKQADIESKIAAIRAQYNLDGIDNKPKSVKVNTGLAAARRVAKAREYAGKMRNIVEASNTVNKQRNIAHKLAVEAQAKQKQKAEQVKQAQKEAATAVNTKPTEKQKEAGNYKKKRLKMHGMAVSIENPKGSVRSGADNKGNAWSNTMAADYGDIKGTIGADGDALDVFLGPDADSDQVFVINQVDPATGDFDEHKVMFGFNNQNAAEWAYQDSYDEGWQGLDSIHRMSVSEFKDWVKNGDTTKPYAGVPKAEKPPEDPEITRSEEGGLAPRRRGRPKKQPEKQVAATAPEHTHNKGKALDKERVYPRPDGPVKEQAELSEGVLRLSIDHDSFAEVTNDFSDLMANPDKKVITSQRVKGQRFISQKAADKKLAEWKAHVKEQFKNARGKNSDKTVLSLFDLTGEWSKPWREAGYNVIAFDIQNGQDVMDFSAQYFIDNWDFGDVYAVLAACPCTDFASSGARWFKEKDADGRTEASKELVFQTMRTIEYFRPKMWALENPVGRIKNLTNLPEPRMTFDPNHFGSPYTKKTVLYGNFNAELPLANVDPVEGSKMHQKYGGKSQATKNARSETPEGFSYSFFMANNYEDLSPLARLEQDYPETSGAVKSALDAGMSESDIRELVDVPYGNFEYHQVRQDLAEAIAARGSSENSVIAQNYPMKEATEAAAHTFRSPGKWAKSNADAYQKAQENLLKDLEKQAGNDRQKAAIPGLMKQFADSYLEQERRIISARSGVVSSHIAGRSNFNSKQSDKRGKTLDRVVHDAEKKVEKARTAAIDEMQSLRNQSQIKADKDRTQKTDHTKLMAKVAGKLSAMNEPGMDAAAFRPGAIKALQEAHKLDPLMTMEALIKIDKSLKELDGKGFIETAGPRSNLAKLFKHYTREIDRDPPPDGTDDNPPKKRREKVKEKADAIDVQINQAASELADLLRGSATQMNSGIDPKILAAGVKLGALYVSKGVVKFAEWGAAIIDELEGFGISNDTVKPILKEVYGATQANVDDDTFERMDDMKTVRKFDLDNLGQSDATSKRDSVERDTPDDATGDGLGESDVSDERGTDGRNTGEAGESTGGTVQQQSNFELSDGSAVAGGTESADRIYNDDSTARIEESVAGSVERGRSRGADAAGVSTKSGAAKRAGKSDSKKPQSSLSFEEKKRLQLAAAGKPIKTADPENIADTLPVLLDEQQGDISKIETRFFENNQPGILVTNGTGTGKTYTGLGTAWRFYQQGKKRILVLAPSQSKVTDWIDEGENLGLPITALKDTKDAGTDVVATTYANFRDNAAVQGDVWDLIITDESHRILEAKDGKGGVTESAFYIASERDSGYAGRGKARKRLRDEYDALDKKKQAEVERLLNDGKSSGEAEVAAADKFANEAQALYKRTDILAEKILAERGDNHTKVLFLSATPFASHKAMKYAYGYVFGVNEVRNQRQEFAGYNVATGFDSFLQSNLGYRMRTNKLTQPDAKVNVSALEIELADNLTAEGAMFGRQLEIEQDYSREFIRVENSQGEKIDTAIYDVINRDDYPALNQILSDRLDYLTRKRIVEGLNAPAAVARTEKHLALGRKVVIFHDLNAVAIPNLFQFDGAIKNDGSKKDEALKAEVKKLESKHPDIAGLKVRLTSVPDAIKSAFGDRAALFRGDVKQSERDAARKAFNDANSGLDVFVIQRQAGKEGLSLHDFDGKAQRALLLAGIPVQATDLTQIEGRIYRWGTQSDAVIEVLSTGLRNEAWAWGTAVSEMTATAENLAFGSSARNISESLRDGYIEYSTTEPNAEQGKGGRERDGRVAEQSPYDKAANYYNKRQKRSQRDKSKEGKDYFATPEPVGFKMAQWANQRDGDSNLEPSGGHGAVARWFNPVGKNKAIEPYSQLYTQLKMVFNGDVITEHFEDHDSRNKYDTIVMNPPFGVGGSDAYKHLEKALQHLKNGGRVVAVLPEGPAAGKRYQKMIDEDWFNNYQLVADMKMPAVMFEQAGTSVMTRVLVIDRYDSPDYALQHGFIQEDFTHIDSVQQLFNELEHYEIPERAEVPEEVLDLDAGGFETSEFAHSKTGETLYRAAPVDRLEKEDFNDLREIAKENGGYYSRFNKGDVKSGFLFKSDEDRTAFLAATGGSDIEQKTPGLEPDTMLRKKTGASKAPNGVGLRDAEKEIQRFIRQYQGFVADDFIIHTSYDRAVSGEYKGSAIRGADDSGYRTFGLVDARNELGHGAGKIHVFLDAHGSTNEFYSTLRHEALIHRGLAAFKPKQVAGLLQKVAATAAKSRGKLGRVWAEIQAEYDELAADYAVKAKTPEQQQYRRDVYLAEELLARLAEKEPTKLDAAWQRVAVAFRNFLARFWPAAKEYKYAETIQLVRDIDALVKTSKRVGVRDYAPLMRRFSKQTAAVAKDRISAAIKSGINAARSPKDAVQSIGSGSGNMTADARKHWLGALTRRHLMEYAGKNFPFLNQYVRTAQEMDTWRNELLSGAGELADKWTNWQRANRKDSQELSRMMHRATIEGVDPSKPFKRIIERKDAEEQLEALYRKAKELGRRGKLAGEKSQAAVYKEIEQIKINLSRDKRRERLHQRLKAEFNRMPAKAKQLFNEVRDHYENHHNQMLQELENLIQRSESNGARTKELIAGVRAEFEAVKVEGPYFPLGRQGDYFAYAEQVTEQIIDHENKASSTATSLKQQGHDATYYKTDAGWKLIATKREFRLFSKQGGQSRWAEDMQKDGYTVRIGKQLNDLKEIDGVNSEFMAGVEELLNGLGDHPAVQAVRDGVYQMYLQTLPQASMRKNFIHRKKMQGYNEDAVRTFAASAFHSSYQLSRLRYSDLLQDQIKQFKQALQDNGRDELVDEYAQATQAAEFARGNKETLNKAWRQWTTDMRDNPDAPPELVARGEILKLARKMQDDAKFFDRTMADLESRKQNAEFMANEDANKATDVYGELVKRHEWAMNPKGGALANWMSSLGFAWYLGVSPAAAMVNMTQTPLVAFPLMAQQFGWKAAGKELLKATRQFIGAGVQKPEPGKQVVKGLSDVLKGEELAAINEGFKSGVLDKTLAHDLASVGQDGANYNHTLNKVNKVIGWAFHNAERANREVTYIAAYRLARSQGKTKEQAIDAAHNLTWESHFDYSSGNKARFMQGDVAKVVLMFRQFSLNMSYLLARNTWQSVKGESPEVRKAARDRLAGILGMHGIFAGAVGLPLYGVVTGILNMMFDDEDEPWNADVAFRNTLVDFFGPVGNVIANGPVNALTGGDVSSRVSLDGLWFRDSGYQEEGREAAESLAVSILGPVFGIAKSGYEGMQLLREGETDKAMEKFVPKFLRDPLKAYRYGSEGATNRRGDVIMEDFGLWELLLQSNGLTPAELSLSYERNSALKGMERRILKRRSALMNRYWMAHRLGDLEGMEEVQAMIERFNSANEAYPITGKTLQRSMKIRQRYSDEAIAGINLNKNLRYLTDDVRY